MNLKQAKALKIGARVRYTCEGPDYDDEGTVTAKFSTGLEITWDDGAEIGYAYRHGDYHFLNLEPL